MAPGIYTFRVPDFHGGFTTHTTPVEILGETGKSYRIRLIGCGARGEAPGRVLYVRKKSVTASGIRRPKVEETDWLPYKD